MNNILKDAFKIEAWLKKERVKNYTLVEDKEYGYVVDVNNSVMLGNRNLEVIPVKFNIIQGFFSCNKNNLTNLDFAPEKVKIFFDCSENRLTSLEGGPKTVGTNLDCSKNKLVSLIGSPEVVPGYFIANDNRLKTLEGGPKRVEATYYAYDNDLETLEFCPEYVGGDVSIFGNPRLMADDGPNKEIINSFELMKNRHLADLVKKEKSLLAGHVKEVLGHSKPQILKI